MSNPPQEKKSGSGRTIAIVIIVILILAGVGAYYFLTRPVSMGHTSGGSTVDIASGTGSNNTLNFNPSAITVKIGVNNTITFTNHDSTTHSVTFTSAPSGVALPAGQPNLGAGQSYTVTLTSPGTYQYHCTFHSWMSGSIVVNSG